MCFFYSRNGPDLAQISGPWPDSTQGIIHVFACKWRQGWSKKKINRAAGGYLGWCSLSVAVSGDDGDNDSLSPIFFLFFSFSARWAATAGGNGEEAQRWRCWVEGGRRWFFFFFLCFSPFFMSFCFGSLFFSQFSFSFFQSPDLLCSLVFFLILPCFYRQKQWGTWLGRPLCCRPMTER